MSQTRLEKVFGVNPKNFSNQIYALCDLSLLKKHNLLKLKSLTNIPITKNVSNKLGEKAFYLAKISKHLVCIIGGVRLEDKFENIEFKVIGSNLL